MAASDNANEDQAGIDDISIFNDEAFSDVDADHQSQSPSRRAADLLNYMRDEAWPLLPDHKPISEQEGEELLGYDPESGV
ncbi:hypothetical protein ACWDTP_16170 [Mycobacterium sp. NPDC003449]